MIRRFIGVYDADGSIVGELSYVLGRAVGRAHCALCDITHGALRERADWRAAVRTLGVPFVTYHRNDQPAGVRALGAALPVVVAEHVDGTLMVVATADELEACGASPSALVDLLRRP